MTIEQSMKDVIGKQLEEGIVERLVVEQLEKGINKALDSLFGPYGDVTKILESKLKSVMVPYLEGYNYSEYIVKLDDVLQEVLKSATPDNKKILNNFKELVTENNAPKTINVSDLFDRWMKYVAENVSTDNLEVDYDDGVSYESVPVTFEIEYDDKRSWSAFEYASLLFECEHDEEMNFAIRLSRWTSDRKEGWEIRYDKYPDIRSLRHLKDFEIFLMKLSQSDTRLIIDEDSGEDDVRPNKEPEPTFS